jgi:hypothetical protein
VGIRRVLRDELLQRNFEENGYVIIPALSADEVKSLEQIYHSNKVDEQPSIELSIKCSDLNISRQIEKLTAGIVTGRMSSHLHDYKMIYSGFVTKIPGRHNMSKLHQDPTFVDETRMKAVNVWCPLVDVDEKNGAVWIVKHSNQFFPGYRGYAVSQFDYSGIFEEVMNRFGTLVKMKAGEALVYDTSLFHYSLHNTSSEIRIACATIMIPAEEAPIYYHYNKNLDSLDVYEIDNDFLLQYFDKYLGKAEIDYKLVSREPFKQAQKISIQQFEEKYFQYNPKPKRSFFDFFTKAKHSV